MYHLIMIVLGIDPGYATVGFGILRCEKGIYTPLEYGVITTPKTDSLHVRLDKISRGFELLIEKYNPEAIAIEELFFHSNQKTAILVAEARGAILLTIYRHCKNIFEYTPLQIKQAVTGYGRADKLQVQTMVKMLLKLDKIPKPDDAADALAVALTHAQSAKFGVLFKA